MRVLWLCGWYPNRHAPFEGDFIQRQARAASLFQEVHILSVNLHSANTDIIEKINLGESVTEIRFYARKKRTIIPDYLLYFLKFRKLLKAYFKEYGAPDLVHIHIPYKLIAIGYWIRYQYHIPLLISEHWGIYDPNLPQNIYEWSKLKQYFLARFLRSADAVISVSAFLAKKMKSFTSIQDPVIIPNVVDTSLFFYQPHQGGDKKTILHISNLHPVKNPSGILNVIKDVLMKRTDVKFLIIGNESDAIVDSARDKGIPDSNIEFLGELPQACVAAQLQKADLLFLYSITETFSCVTAEALCCGVPVVASRVGALSELIDDSNGLLTASDDKALGNALHFALDIRKWEHEKIAGEVQKKYSFYKVGKQLSELYESFQYRS